VDQTEIMLRNSPSGLSKTEAYLSLKAFLAKNIDNAQLKTKVADYFTALEKAGLTDAGLFSSQSPPSAVHRAPSTVNRAPSTVHRLPSLLLLSPFFLLGYGFWFLPCWLPWLLCKRLDLYPGYDSNVKMLAGLFTFPLALWGGWKLAFWLFGSSIWAWVALGVLIGCGYLAEVFMEIAKSWRERRAVRDFQKNDPAGWRNLREMRAEILTAM
jgi:hypothetical protein